MVDTPVPVTVKEGLQAVDVTSEDVALLSVAETTLLVDTHVIISDIGIVLDGIGPDRHAYAGPSGRR
jgi:hypothetical protein